MRAIDCCGAAGRTRAEVASMRSHLVGHVKRKGRRHMKELLVRFVREDEGQDLVEYALLIAFIALLCILGMQTLGQGINKKFSDISSSLNAS